MAYQGARMPNHFSEYLPQDERLRQQIAACQAQWDLLTQKLALMERDLILETRADEKFRLEHLLAPLKVERAQIQQQLIDLETQLAIQMTAAAQRDSAQPVLTFAAPRSTSVNPFGARGRITNPAQFFDRDDLLRQIFEELHKGVNVSLVGESAVGKSSVLAMVGEQGRSLTGGNFIYFNLEWVESEDDFYDAFCDEIGIESCRGYKFTRALKGKRCVLCLDEIEKMAWASFTVNVRSHLRGLADGPDAPLKLVIASRSPLAHLFPDSPELDSPLAGICRQIDVQPFSAAIAREFLIQWLTGTGVTFTEAQISTLIAVSGGHPAKLQEAAANLFRELSG